MQHRERIALEKICSEIDLALKFVENITPEEFLADEKTKRAVGMTAINIVMPQLGKVLVGKYASATITQLTGIYRLI